MKKKIFSALGIMTGTSIDGVDLSLIKSDGINEFEPILDDYFEFNKNIQKKTEKLRDGLSNIDDLDNEIRLTKQFLKAVGAYGANSAIGGFSGYLVEILCIKYKGFLNLIKEISQWKPPVIIDKMRTPDSPIMLCDPVDKNRNVGPYCFGLGIGKPFGFFRNSFRCYMGDFRRIFTCKSCRMGRSYQEVLHRFINSYKRKGSSLFVCLANCSFNDVR